MTIKHLVISGGGPLGLRFLGALQYLEQNNFWKLENIQSIYATSVGTIIAVFICLGFDWPTLNKYIIERPWQDAFKISVKQILHAYGNKGLFDKNLCEIVLKPLLKAKDLKLHITLQEFYDYCKIDIHFFTFDINNFQTYEINYINHPNMLLVEALTISSSLPGIFMPTILDEKCLIDGGVMCNFPINECLRDHTLADEILGIKIEYENNENNPNLQITQDTTLLEYTICLTTNAMNFIKNSVSLQNIKNILLVKIDNNPLSLDEIKLTINNQEIRQNLINKGFQDAINFLQNCV